MSRSIAIGSLFVAAALTVPLLAACAEEEGCCHCTFSGDGCSGIAYFNQKYGEDKCERACYQESLRIGCPMTSSDVGACEARSFDPPDGTDPNDGPGSSFGGSSPMVGGSGGTTASGGSGGSAGSAMTGGTAGTDPVGSDAGPGEGPGQLDSYTCVGEPVDAALVTDFSDIDGETWGTADGIQGVLYSVGLPPATVSISTDAARLDVSGSTGAETGIAVFGLAFDRCWDAGEYSGIEFLLDGDLGGCPLQLTVHTNDTTAVNHESRIGACLENCLPASVTLPNTTGTITVAWTDLTSTIPFNPATLVGIGWTLIGNANCIFNFAIDDVRFVE